MSKPTDKYATLDAHIIVRLTLGPQHFHQLASGMIHDECQRIADLEPKPRRPFATRVTSDRILDRRLQALRRAGKITYVDQARGWSLTRKEQ